MTIPVGLPEPRDEDERREYIRILEAEISRMESRSTLCHVGLGAITVGLAVVMGLRLWSIFP